jgi:hypothetical protein
MAKASALSKACLQAVGRDWQAIRCTFRNPVA